MNLGKLYFHIKMLDTNSARIYIGRSPTSSSKKTISSLYFKRSCYRDLNHLT